MLEDKYRLMIVLEKAGGIRGRKKLQKMFYLMQMLGYDYSLDYSYQNYGPYSAQLQFEVDMLVAEELLGEGFDHNTYSYSVTTKGKEFLRLVEEKGLTDIGPEVPTDLLSELKQYDAQLLELASTMMFLGDLGFRDGELFQRVSELKPRLVDRYQDAQTFIMELSGRS